MVRSDSTARSDAKGIAWLRSSIATRLDAPRRAVGSLRATQRVARHRVAGWRRAASPMLRHRLRPRSCSARGASLPTRSQAIADASTRRTDPRRQRVSCEPSRARATSLGQIVLCGPRSVARRTMASRRAAASGTSRASLLARGRPRDDVVDGVWPSRACVTISFPAVLPFPTGSHIPGALATPKGAVPAPARGPEHTAPTCIAGSRDRTSPIGRGGSAPFPTGIVSDRCRSRLPLQPWSRKGKGDA